MTEYLRLKVTGGIQSNDYYSLFYKRNVLICMPDSYDREEERLNLKVFEHQIHTSFDYYLN